MIKKIHENQILNNENFLTPTERNFLENEHPHGKIMNSLEDSIIQ